MSEYEYIEQRLHSDMVSGNMHHTLRDVGRIVGGHVSAGRLTQDEADRLGELAVSLSLNKAEARRKWAEATSFGLKQPLPKTEFASPRDGGHAVDWDEVVNPNDYKIVDEKWLEKESVVEPSENWNPCAELKKYIKLMFRDDEYVAITVTTNKDGGPSGGTYHLKAGEIANSKYLEKGTIEGVEDVIGSVDESHGAWVCVNPIDGKGREKKNLTAFRHALVECDEKSIEEQVSIYRKLELPCVCIVHSGGKSAHAIVKIDASDEEEYKKRVDFLYKVCENNGAPVDKQCRNAGRLSRLPGVIRNGNKQFIISGSCGKASWNEWENWIKDLNDDLPDFEPFTADVFNNPPEKAPELISGILRVGDNMIISGPPKAGKSFLLIDLCIAIATGGEWIGHKCAKGRVLYINLELNKASCVHRIIDICKEKNVPPPIAGADPDIYMWNLRGKAKPIDKLAPSLIRRVNNLGNAFSMIVLDPAYLVFPGDESSSSDAGTFMRSLIKIATECKSTIVLCHHHSKGGQGDKRSMDRASGSGVFSRAPDAIIDLLPLESEKAKEVFRQSYECAAMAKEADNQDYDDGGWREKVSQDDMIVPNKLEGALQNLFSNKQLDAVRDARAAVVKTFDSVTGWRVSFSLRDFASPSPQNIWFKWPVHIIDGDGTLSDAVPEGQKESPWERKFKKAKENRVPKNIQFKNIVESDPTETWTVKKAMQHFGVGENAVRKWLTALHWKSKNGVIVVDETKKDGKDDMPF